MLSRLPAAGLVIVAFDVTPRTPFLSHPSRLLLVRAAGPEASNHGLCPKRSCSSLSFLTAVSGPLGHNSSSHLVLASPTRGSRRPRRSDIPRSGYSRPIATHPD